MKKLICVLLAVMMLAVLFVGCIGSFECDLCGEDKFGIMHEDEFLGQDVVLCDDCYEDLEDLRDAFN